MITKEEAIDALHKGRELGYEEGIGMLVWEDGRKNKKYACALGAIGLGFGISEHDLTYDKIGSIVGYNNMDFIWRANDASWKEKNKDVGAIQSINDLWQTPITDPDVWDEINSK